MYFAQSELPWDFSDDVKDVWIFARPPQLTDVPPSIHQECELHLYSDEWYMGDHKVFKSRNAIGHFYPQPDVDGHKSFMVRGFCDRVVFYNQQVWHH